MSATRSGKVRIDLSEEDAACLKELLALIGRKENKASMTIGEMLRIYGQDYIDRFKPLSGSFRAPTSTQPIPQQAHPVAPEPKAGSKFDDPIEGFF